ncbi:MAG: hypothetical protein U0Z53_15230 [Blastocatellia bacterium]
MAVSKKNLIEMRLATLEAEVEQLKGQVETNSRTKKDWLDETYGVFANDPVFDEIVELGRKYRESLRPRASGRAGSKKAKGRKTRNVRTR